MTTTSHQKAKEALLNAARQLNQVLQDSIVGKQAASEAYAACMAASKVYSETYTAWEEITVKLATLKLKVPLLKAASVAASEANAAQWGKIQEAACTLWRACAVADDSEILEAAAIYGGQTQEKAHRLRLANEADKEYRDSEQELSAAYMAQREAYEKHEEAKSALQSANVALQKADATRFGRIANSNHGGYAHRRHSLYDAEREVTKAACEYAGVPTEGYHLAHGVEADQLGLTLKDLQASLPADAEHPVSRSEGVSWMDIIAAIETARPAGASRPLTPAEWEPAIDSISTANLGPHS